MPEFQAYIYNILLNIFTGMFNRYRKLSTLTKKLFVPISTPDNNKNRYFVEQIQPTFFCKVLVNFFLVSESHMVFVTTFRLCHHSVNAAIDDM